MNGFSSPRNPYPQGYSARSSTDQRPPMNAGGRLAVDGARKDRNAAQPLSSLVDLDDPIQIHLLTESALFDSRRYEVLSEEEVGDLKKQCQSLTQRISKTRSNLAVQTKYRDAAVSMAKLYSPGRQTPMGSRGSNRDSAEEADLERRASERKCDELAAELVKLEKRLMEPQRRLLEHTAGILQMTHKASRKQQLQTQGNMPVPNGIPGSPESLYAYSNDRGSIGGGDDAYLDFADPVERMRGQENSIDIPMKSAVRGQDAELRQERDQLRLENDRLRGETAQLRAQSDAFGLEIDALRREGSDQDRDATNLERSLESLNSSLRDVIVAFNPSKNSNYRMPPATSNGPATGPSGPVALGYHLEYLAASIAVVRREQEQQQQQPSGARSLDTRAEGPAKMAMTQAEGRIDDLSQQMTNLLLRVNATPPPPPNASAMGSTGLELDDRISHLEYSFRVVEAEFLQAMQGPNDARSLLTGSEDAEPKLRELWDIVQSGLLELQSQREARRKMRIEKGLEDDEEEMTVDQTFDLGEQYNPVGLQSRVRTVASQISKLTEQKNVLKRQIKQQRELNNQSSGEKDIEIQNRDVEIERRIIEVQNKEIELQGKIAELDAREAELAELQIRVHNLTEERAHNLTEQRAHNLTEERSANDNSANSESRIRELETKLADANQYLEQSRTDASQTEGMLAAALQDLDTANQDAETRQTEGLEEARAELEEKKTALAAMDSSSKDLESRLKMTESSRAALQARVDEIDGRAETLEVGLLEAQAALEAAEASSEFMQKEVDSKQREIREKDDVLENLNLMVVELKTELTIARAELDGAYGSRAERAADMAAIQSSGEVSNLRDQIDTYKTELDQTLKQLEEVTRETIGAEREKMEVETRLDDAVAARSTLEAEIRDLQERLDDESGAARDKIDRLQEELDTARLRVGTGEGGGGGRVGAAMLSEQFRNTMREERKKFQEDLREEHARRRKLEEELSRLRRAQGPGKSPLSPGRV